MKSLLALVLILVASAASASQVTGTASLTMYTDGGFGASPQTITIRLIQREDGKISGGVDFGSVISLEKKDGVWKGYAYDGFVELGCTADSCRGTVHASSARLSVARETGKLEGNLNFTQFDALNTAEKIEVSADGWLSMKRNRNGSYSGTGYLPRRGGDLPESFSATLAGDGTLARIEDPALFTIFLVTPFVLDPFSR